MSAGATRGRAAEVARWPWRARALLVVLVVLSGAALFALRPLPRGRLNWQAYAGMFPASVTLDQARAQPGSLLTVRGENFPPRRPVTLVIAHGQPPGTVRLGQIVTDAGGRFQFQLDTSAAAPGAYSLAATFGPRATATISFVLDARAPLRRPALPGGPAGDATARFAVGGLAQQGARP